MKRKLYFIDCQSEQEKQDLRDELLEIMFNQIIAMRREINELKEQQKQ